MTKLASSLPEGDGNGLVAIARPLVEQPHDIHVAVVLLDCKKISTDVDTGAVEPTARIRRVEVVLAEDHPLAQKMLRRALEKRTGKTVLPFDLEEDLRAAFGGIDPNTGEIFGDGAQ